MDLVAFIHSPFKTKVEWEVYAALPAEERLTHVAILSDYIGLDIAKATLRNQSKMGGMSGDIKFIDVVLTTGKPLALVLKTASGSERRAHLGNAREAFFYNEFAAELSAANVPKCFYAHGDLATGEVVMLLEALEDAVPSGVFFGAAQPNNWSVRDRLPQLCAGNPGPEQITIDAFALYARMHAIYWRDASLCSRHWLRGSSWQAGTGQVSWEAAQAQARGAWAHIRPSITSGGEPGGASGGESAALEWDSHLVACLDASFAKADWAAYHAELAARPFTLVHGDAHAHNFMWTRQRSPDARQVLIDFEMVGVGSNAQELGQYIISHVPAAMRRAHTHEWVAAYHKELVAALRARGLESEAAAYTPEACFAEHVAGGVGRWVWFVPILISMGLPSSMNQYFHDQLATFLHDHIPDPADTPMPRV